MRYCLWRSRSIDAVYDGVSYCVFELDEDALVWGDEGVYYLME